MNRDRRRFLRGLGGAALGLPFLEGMSPRRASAQTAVGAEPFAIFFRQANGVAQAWGDEPERFFPRELGALTEASMQGRATGELAAHRSRLLILQSINYRGFDYGDGHANGALQALTGQGPTEPGAAGGSQAAGESIDHRIGRELNPGGDDSLFLYAGRNRGWLGGACISYRGPGQRRSAVNNPFDAYLNLMGGATGLDPEAQDRLVRRRESVNDLVRTQLNRLRSSPGLSTRDRQRLDLHLSSVRDLEVQLSCRLDEDRARMLENQSPGYDSTDGEDTLRTARLHMDVAALAVACAANRSVAIQVGSGNDGSTRYHHPETGQPMANFHYLSHRRLSHGSDGEVIPDSDLLHHYVDVQFARTFRHLLDRLAAYDTPDGGSLLDAGVAVWYNDNANGPPHGRWNVPWVLAGSAGGFLRQGQHLRVQNGTRDPNLTQLLNTLGTAVGVRSPGRPVLDDFGASGSAQGLLSDIVA
ncbi:MAG TPA: DUF1552 domain-containing protein [Myxococcales bacterium LLY-WYZ-16_1]|nr:DUF1552 domain-containing protein [Myxococcales bacterium LLY-WYZ-16_1]